MPNLDPSVNIQKHFIWTYWTAIEFWVHSLHCNYYRFAFRSHHVKVLFQILTEEGVRHFTHEKQDDILTLFQCVGFEYIICILKCLFQLFISNNIVHQSVFKITMRRGKWGVEWTTQWHKTIHNAKGQKQLQKDNKGCLACTTSITSTYSMGGGLGLNPWGVA